MVHNRCSDIKSHLRLLVNEEFSVAGGKRWYFNPYQSKDVGRTRGNVWFAVRIAELERLRILQLVHNGFQRRRDAASGLGVSERQLRRLLHAFEAHEVASVASKKRGKASNNRRSEKLRMRVVERCRADYRYFGPTLLAKTLATRDGIHVSREWLRLLLVENDLWHVKHR